MSTNARPGGIAGGEMGLTPEQIQAKSERSRLAAESARRQQEEQIYQQTQRANAEEDRRRQIAQINRDNAVMGSEAVKAGGSSSTDAYGSSYAFPGGGSGGVGSGNPSGSKAPQQGGFGTSVPQIDGRYMSLVAPPNPTLNESTPAQVKMGEGNFTPTDATAHQDAAFARTKDKAGALGKSAIDSLSSMLAGRGVSNQSGTFGRGLVDRISAATNPLADLNVAHLGEEYDAANNARQMSEARASTEYQGGIAQRSQDMSSQQAMNNLKTQLALAGYNGNLSQLEMLYRLVG